MGSPLFKHQLRAVFAALTASTALFTVVAARALGTSWLAASISGAVVLSSFQVLYHSRWIAPDTLMMAAGAMTLGATLWATRDCRVLPLIMAAVAAGLATAAKYPGGCLLLLPLVAAARSPAPGRRVIAVLALFATTYLLVTPGTVVNSERFVNDLLFVIHHYRQRGHGGYTVGPGWPHLIGILDFLAFRLASPYAALSALVLSLALLGVVVAWRVNRQAAVLLTVVPALYVAFMVTNRVLIVRNYLILIPFVAVLVAVAIDAIAGAFRRPAIRAGIPLAASVLLAFNWPGFLHAVSSLNDLDPDVWRKSVSAYFAAHPDRRFAVSPRVAALLAPGTESAANVYPLASSDAYLYVLGEHRAKIANRRNKYRVIAGPRRCGPRLLSDLART